MNALTINELEELLADAKRNGADGDTPVHFSYNYGDHWRTTVAPGAYNAELGKIEYSTYHSMHKVVDEEEMYDDEGNDVEHAGKQVLIIS